MSKKIKVLGILGTLKTKDSMSSNTEELLNAVYEKMKPLGATDFKTVRLVDMNIKHGLMTDMMDDGKAVIQDIIDADIVIWATPIWWGQPSSLIQKLIERMDQLDNEYMMSGMSKLKNKVAGIVVTGHEDGVQHVVGTLANALTWYGFCLPPECAAYWVGEVGPPMNKDAEKRRVNMATNMMTDAMAMNLVNYATIIGESTLLKK